MKRKGGFEPFTMDDYEITEKGEVYNKKWNRFVKPQPNGKGYLRVMICGKKRFVHRLVAEKYIPNPSNKPQVNHKDGNKLNNCVDNLEWVTNSENRKHAVANGLHSHGECSYAKLTYEDVCYIRNHPDETRNEIAEKYHISPSHVSAIRNYRTWKI